MTDYNQSDWTELDADNDGVSPNGVQGGYAPSQIAPIIRAIRGAAKRDFVRSNPKYTTTGTGNAFVLTYQGAPEAYSKGDIYRFFVDRANTGAATLNINGLGAKAIVMPDGSALSANQIKDDRVLEVVYNGTAFVMNGYVDQNLKFGDVSANTLALTTALPIPSGGTGAITAAAARTSLGTDNANNITTGTLADARLPTSIAGKTFTSLTSFYSANYATGGDIARFIPSDIGAGKPGMYIKKTPASPEYVITFWDGADAGGGILNITPESSVDGVRVNGNKVWHAGNDGASSGLDSDLLDGQHGSYYLSAANLTGTLADARLPTSMAGKTFTSDVHVNGADFTIDHTVSADLRFELNNVLSGRLYRDVSGGLVMRRYNETTGAAEGYIQITGNGVNDAKYNGNIMWHAGNDGSGSTLDADLLDGYQAVHLYRNNADFTTSGQLTISNGSPYIRLQDTTTSAYDGRVRLDANNLYIDGSSDGVNYGEVLRFELDTKVGYMSQLFLTTSGEAIRLAAPTAGQDPYISWYSGAARTGYIQYSDSGTHTGFFITNDVSDDKLGIDNSGGTSALRFWDNSRSALDVVLTSANIDTYDLAKYYVGSSRDHLDFPLGHMVVTATGAIADRNGTATIRLRAETWAYTGDGTGSILVGVWRQRGGWDGQQYQLWQRVS